MARRWKFATSGAGVCHLDRDVPALLAAGGFRTDVVETAWLEGPRIASYVYRGAASPA